MTKLFLNELAFKYVIIVVELGSLCYVIGHMLRSLD